VKTPLRPVRITFVLGKGQVKRRRESANPTRFIAEQLLVEVLNDNWEHFKSDLSHQIASDVHRELNHLAADFRHHIIGLTDRQKRPSGMLTTVAKGPDRPEQSLAAAYGQDWIPRSAKYLKYKKGIIKHTRWFLFDGYLDSKFKGEYIQGANTDSVGRGSGGEFDPGGGIFEDLFGPVSVQVIRNRTNWGLNPGGSVTNTMGSKAKFKVKLATVRVRALGSITDAMLHVGGFNSGLMSLIRRKDEQLANRLGGRYHYRPTLEPFLEFFLQRALPHAVSERIRKGTLGTSIIRAAPH